MNYSVATRLVKETFDKPYIIISKLYDRLLQLPTAEESFPSLKSVYMDMESLLQQLENQGEVFGNQRLLSQQLLSMCPFHVREKFAEWWLVDAASSSWPVLTLRQYDISPCRKLYISRLLRPLQLVPVT